MKNMCANCPKRDKCTKLCPKAEEYVNQDWVDQKELIGTYPIGDYCNMDTWIGDINFDNPGILKNAILKLYFEDKKGIREIGRMLPCSHQYVHKIIRKHKKVSTKK